MSDRNYNANRRPALVTAVSLFFIFGACMSGLAALMLLFPNSPFEPLWNVNQSARTGFDRMGDWAVLLMAVVCTACLTAAVGLWRCRRWGYRIAVVILTINLVGDTLNAIFASDLRTLIGLPIGLAMIVALRNRRSAFR